MELNVANKKYVIFCIYRRPKQNINYFWNGLSEALDLCSKHANICLMILMQHLQTHVWHCI